MEEDTMTQQRQQAQLSRVLIVEDNAAQLSTLTAILEDEGFVVSGCPTAHAALTQMQRNTFGVIILDWRLPDVNGPQLLEQLRKLDDTVRIIINTAYGSFDSAKDHQSGGIRLRRKGG